MRKLLGIGAFIGLFGLCAPAYAAGFVGIQDPTNPGYVAAVDSTGHLSTTGTVSTVTTVGTITNPVKIVGTDGSTISSSSNPVPTLQYFDGTTKVKGTAGQTSTTSTSLISAVTSKIIYVMNLSCTNNGASDSLVAIQDGSGGTTLASILAPHGSGFIMAASYPIVWTTAGNALFFAPGTASTTVTCNASGFSGN